MQDLGELRIHASSHKLPLSDPLDDDTLIQGKQSILLSSALAKSRTIRATKAVICKRKSKRTASAAKTEDIDSEHNALEYNKIVTESN